MSNPELHERIDNDFTQHPIEAENQDRITAVRAQIKEAAHLAATVAPDSRELILALSALEEAAMQVTAAIARNQEYLPELDEVTAAQVAAIAENDRNA
jgi:Trk K+ transport system NAD-binding subunit